MPGFLSSLEAIGTGFGQGAEAIQRQQQAAAQVALQRQALQQQQQRQQTLAALLPGLVAAYGGQQGGQQQPGPPAGFTGPGFTTPGATGGPTPLMPQAAPGAAPAPLPPAMPPQQYAMAPPQQQVSSDIGADPTGTGVAVPPSLQPISAHESGGNYRAQNPVSSASGAFQDIDQTWREAMQGLGYGNAYPHAKDAPPAVQNAANIWLQARRGNKPWPWAASAPGAGLTGAGQTAARSFAQNLPAGALEQGHQAAGQAAEEFDPMEYGRVSMQRAVEAIDKQDIPPEVKAAAIMQMATILQPQDRMMLSMYAMQNRDLIAQSRLNLQAQGQAQRGNIAEENLKTRRTIAGIGEPGEAPTQNVENVAEMISNYQMAPLSGWTMRGAWGQSVMNRVREINPDYQATQFSARQSGARAFASGRQADTVRSMSVAIDHLGVAENLSKGLQNNDVRLLNQAQNMMKTQFGYEGPVDFNTAKMIVSDEVTKAVAGGVLSMTERVSLADQLSAANSPEQLTGVIGTLRRLMAGQLGGLRRQFESATGGSADQFDQLLSPQAKEQLGVQSKEQERPSGTPVPKEYESDPDGTTYNGGKMIKRGNELVPQ